MEVKISLQDVRTKKYGNHVFISYISLVTGKRRRLKKKETGLLPTHEAAEAWAAKNISRLLDKELRLLKRQEWRHAAELVKQANQFRSFKKLEYPKSYTVVCNGLVNYVLPFFVTECGLKDPNTWYPEHQKFKAWLLTDARCDDDRKLSVSTANKAINSLNKFCLWLRDHQRSLDWNNYRPLEAYPNKMLNRRGAQDLIDDQEVAMVTAQLRSSDEDLVADGYLVQRHTGLRLSELLGLHLGSLTTKIPDEIKEAFHKVGITEFYGAIYLDSQPADAYISRDGHEIRRGPLKWREEISPKYARTIPIHDKVVWNILAERFKVQKELYAKGTHGPKKDNYLLLDGGQRTPYMAAIKEAFWAVGLRPRPSHLLRHTRNTELTMLGIPDKILEILMGNKELAQKVYQHIVEVLNRKTQQEQDFEDIETVA